MWDTLAGWLQHVGVWGGWTLVWLSCVAGVVLSCVSISGTWLVALASLVALLLTPDTFPGWWCVTAFLVVSAAVEGMEWFAGTWGVKRRGGSGWAGFAALVGGLGGMVVGGIFVPMPLVGSVLGMMLGGFGLTFVVEQRRLRHTKQAATIAWGAVVGRVVVIVGKVICTLLMIGILIVGLLRG